MFMLSTISFGSSTDIHTMLKSELVKRIHAQNGHLYPQDIDKLVNIVLDEIANAMKNGSRVELRGFGSFSIKTRDARVGRNPRTGTQVEVDAKLVPVFRCSKELHKRLNDPQPSQPEQAGADQ